MRSVMTDLRPAQRRQAAAPFARQVGSAQQLDLLRLQQLAGNAAVSAMLSGSRASPMRCRPVVAQGRGDGVKGDRPRISVVQRDAEQPAAAEAQPGAPAAEERVCGPEIDPQLTAVLSDIGAYYDSMNPVSAYLSCNAITFPMTAGMAWDIQELFLPNTGWLRKPPFAGRCGVPSAAQVESPAACSNSVRVGGKCNLAGTANYSMLGMVVRKCGPLTPEKLGRANITALVNAWKAVEAATTGKWDDPTPAIEFAHAVYDRGPSGRPSTENRPTCTGRCDERAVPAFTFRWLPFH